MISRTSLAAMLSVALTAILAAQMVEAATYPPLDAAKMIVALRAGRPQDKAFIEAVARLTNEGRLSRSLVTGSFQWARKKSRNRPQYFRLSILHRLAAGKHPIPTELLQRIRPNPAANGPPAPQP